MVSRLRKLVTLCALLSFAMTASAGAAGHDSSFRALSGADASRFSIPGDMRLVKAFPLLGLRYERYQQLFGSREAEVLGGQITVYRRSSGEAETVIGARYSGIRPSNEVAISGGEARAVAERDVGTRGRRLTTLMISPASGRYFYRIETRRLATRWVHWIDAADGKVIRRFNAITKDHGTGVKGDTKDINGSDNASTADDLTTFHNASGHGASGAHWDLFSKDNRQTTYDARNKSNFLYYAFDADNHWVTPGRTSPGQPALVDAQYYANVTDDYFQSKHGLDWIGDCQYTGGMQSLAHYKRNYANAFWNGTYVIYGDGDGVADREYSGGLDIVAHEHTHGVTDCTSELIYSGESGALNESFSDVLGNSAEFYAAAGGLDPAAAPDWKLGEDIDLTSDAVAGFRNMADPREDADPDHYSERYTGTSDSGGVHTNSGIPNHAYYLLVNGGKNAGCDNVGSNGHTHTLDCDVTVTGIGVADAERIFFQGFTSLPTNATMCQARQATDAAALSLFGVNSPQRTSTGKAWDAVGIHANCGGTAPASYSQTILGTPGLVSYWRLGEPSGTTAQDSTDNNLDGTYVNTPTLGAPGALTGDADLAVTLTNASSEYIRVADNALLDVGDTFTLELWLKRTSLGTTYKLLNKGPNGFVMALSPATNAIQVGKEDVAFIADSTVAIEDTTTWHHVVWAKAGATNNLYIDGVDVTGAVFNQTVASTSNDLFVGAKYNLSEFFNGSLDEVAIYNTALSAATVSNHYHAAGH